MKQILKSSKRVNNSQKQRATEAHCKSDDYASPERIRECIKRQGDKQTIWMLNALTRVSVTFFPNEGAQSKKEARLSLYELRDRIQQTSRPSKDKLPWLKLCVFGKQRTDRNSLRSNANVVAVSGIELDYDQKKVSFEDAIATVKAAKLMCLIYTTANYQADKPKWRLLLPLSRVIAPARGVMSDREWGEMMTAERARLVARVNGLFGGVFDNASFTLSQSYYFGGIGESPSHRAEVVAGEYINQRSDLDAGAIFKRGEKAETSKSKAEYFKEYGEEATKKVARDDIADLTVNILRGVELHDSIRDLAMHYVRAGMHAGAVVKLLRGLLNQSSTARDERWRERFNDIPRAVSSAAEKCETEQEEEETTQQGIKSRLMQSSAEFVANFTPPDYLIDGLLQRRYVYSLTGPTGSGKTAIALRIAIHVALGLPLAEREVVPGRVLMFAGENPDDVRTRWIKLCEVMEVEPDAVDVVFMPFTPDLAANKIRKRIDDEASERGPFSLLIVDTSASYYSGDDENDNVALGNHARLLRSFVNLPGGPTILVTCHPTKNPDMMNLLPRGGGAFLAEVDGNLVAIKERGSMVVEISTHGKFRGPDFAPFSFELAAATSDKLVDTKERSIWTVYAKPISNEEQEQIEEQGNRNQDELLCAMLDKPGQSLAEMATYLNWKTMDKRPNKLRVQRMLEDLKKTKLVEKRRDGHYVLTKKGEDEAEKTAEIAEPVQEKTKGKGGREYVY